MNRIPAHTGWLWVKRGFALFRRQPGEMLTLFLTYVLLMFFVGLIPVLGRVLPMVLVPLFSIGFLQACADIEAGRRVTPRLVLAGPRSPHAGRLLRLGVLHLLGAGLAIGASTLVDGGLFWKMIGSRHPLDPKTVDAGALLRAMLTALAVYTPASMALWYAAPLVHWQKMGVFKALFYSFFAFWRALGAFTIYGLGWLAVGVLLPTLVSVFLMLATGSPDLAVLLLLPVSVVLTVVMYCSFYPTYTAVFGPLAPDGAPPAAEPPAA